MLLIDKYPIFAKKVLDTYGIVKQPFESEGDSGLKVRAMYNVWLVSPYKEKKESKKNRSLSRIVENDRIELATHPLVVYVFEFLKWKRIVRTIFYLEFSLQCLIVAILIFASVFSNNRLNLGEFYTTVFVDPGWRGIRILIIFVALLDLVWRTYVPIRNLTVLKKFQVTYRLLSYLVLYITLITYVFSTFGGSQPQEAQGSLALSILQLLLMLNIISYLPLFPGIGPVVLGVGNAIAPITYWGMFFIIVFIAFSVSLTAVASNLSPLNYSSIYWTMNTLFLGMFGQGDPISDLLYNQNGLGLTLYYLFLIIVPLILFNILIALVTNAYMEIEQAKEGYWRLFRGKLIAELEESIPSFLKKKFYPSQFEYRTEDFSQEPRGDEKEEKDVLISELIQNLDNSFQHQNSLINDLLKRQESMEEKQKLITEKITNIQKLVKKSE